MDVETNTIEYITLQTLGFGSLRLGKNYATVENIESLCQVSQMILADSEGEEVKPEKDGKFTSLSSTELYTVVSEADVERSDANPKEISHEEELELYNQELMKRLEKIDRMNEARKKFIAEKYTRKHPQLWNLTEDKFDPSFLEAVKSNSNEQMMKILHKETETEIYTFEMFTEKFCDDLIEEVEHFESTGLPNVPPNSMNNYGVVLSDLGFDNFFTELLGYVKPVASLLYGRLGESLDSHHAFIVQYKTSEDLDLGFHYDESEVTINICLGKEFTGGSLYFKGLLEREESHSEKFELVHHKRRAVFHIGKHRHGANQITSGERFNLIIWWRDSRIRKCC